MDLDFIKAKLDALQGKNKQTSKFWKPTGDHTIRILPYTHNKKSPFIELKFYYYLQANGTTKTFLAPSVNGNPDPVLEFCGKLRATGTKENWILSKRYEPKLRTYCPILVRGQEDEGVKFWGFGKQVYESILEKISNPDIGTVDDLQEGNDLIVKFTKTPSSGKKYPETKVDFRIKKTPAIDPNKQELIAKIENQVDIMTLFTEPTYEELKREFELYLAEEADPDAAPDVETQNLPDPNDVVPDTHSVSAQTLTSPSAEAANANVNMTPEEMKAKFKSILAASVSK